jgi:Ca2+-binding RTX toxin-like protein
VANDRLVINAGTGDDVVNASSLEADGIQLTINGGLGNDQMIGSEGDDLITGGDGNDIAFMGAGDDIFVWNPGDDNDTIEGQDGFDTLVFNGANIAETINITANGGRALFTRDVANVVMDLNDVESIDFNALGGADIINIHDLTGTDLTEINLNLGVAGGGGDGAADTIIIDGTNGDDVVLVFGDDGSVTVLGLGAQVNITGFEAGLDRLIIRTQDGDDVVDASGLGTGSIPLTAEGGVGNDILIGGDGADRLFGEIGDDVLIGGPGLDILDGGPGDNILIQGETTFVSAIDIPMVV